MNLHARVRRTIRRHGLIAPGARVIVALSGGADSVALLHVLADIARADGFHIAGIAHLNHQLRGEASDLDEAFCRRLAAAHGLPIDVERADIVALARETGASIEQAAHDARHAFFARAAARLHAARVAVAHTRDDQAETYLLRLLRGAGPRGLGGMHPRSGLVIRPLIETPRADLRDFLQRSGIEHREDASNADPDIPRNRVRLELIPFLEARFSPGIVGVLDREAAIARDDAEFLDAAADAAAARLVVRAPGRVEIPVDALLAEPPAIVRRVIRDAQQAAAGGRFVGFEAVEAVLELMVSNLKGPLDLPGHRVNRLGNTIVLTQKAGRGISTQESTGGENAFSYELTVPGRVGVPEASCAIVAEVQAARPGAIAGTDRLLSNRGDEAAIDASGLAGPLVVRSRRPGDSFHPLGLHGRKKLQDFFVDRKVHRDERDAVPLVVDSKGQIVWVAGHSIAEEFKVTTRTEAVVILKRVSV